jgi:ABC-2 type transport system permease protein
VLSITNEYTTGMIRNTFGAVPRRSAVRAAKLVGFAVVALVVGEVASFIAFFVGQSTRVRRRGQPGQCASMTPVVGDGKLPVVSRSGDRGQTTRRSAAWIVALVIGVVVVAAVIYAVVRPNFAAESRARHQEH